MKNNLAVVRYAFAAAVLFGLSAPLSKWLLGGASPFFVAGLLYLGSGVGLSLVRVLRRQPRRPLEKKSLPWFAGAILAGGVIAPVSLMWGLSTSSAAMSSLLLNLEGVFTALLAWFFFKENVGPRVALGMLLIVVAGVGASWQGEAGAFSVGSLGVALACLGWAIDNNLTQKVSTEDPFQIAALKGVIAGSVNLLLSLALGASLPSAWVIIGSLLLGFFSYGLSLVLFVLSLRHIGTSRTGAYFALAPFVGALSSILLLRESMPPLFWGVLALMALGVWLHLSEHHEHEHSHEPLTHSHPHSHDAHHQHEHPEGVASTEPHEHEHTHEPLNHAHPHFPDVHHRHSH